MKHGFLFLVSQKEAKNLNAWLFYPHTGEARFIEKIPGSGSKKFTLPS
jgi:hypothetical protein